MKGIKQVLLWAFVSGFLNGLLLGLSDYLRQRETKDADQSEPP